MDNNLTIKHNVPLAPLTTFRVGGEAEWFVVVETEEELVEAASESRCLSLPLTVLGDGSNVLVSDEGVEGFVIKNEISGIEYKEEGDEILVTAGAGVVWDELVMETVEQELWGMENLSAIPGTTGATPIQNVGAYGVEVSELIDSVRVYDSEKDTWQTFSKQQCEFSYRNSIFKKKAGKNLIVTAVTFRLTKKANPKLHYKDLENYFTDKKNAPTLKEIRDAVIEIRARKFPDLNEVGTAGSFFKNPVVDAAKSEALCRQYPDLPVFPETTGRVKISLGYVLDQVCGLRGYREGNVGLFDKQALVLVNYGGATASEIEDFAQKISKIVFAKTKIKIDWEPKKLF